QSRSLPAPASALKLRRREHVVEFVPKFQRVYKLTQLWLRDGSQEASFENPCGSSVLVLSAVRTCRCTARRDTNGCQSESDDRKLARVAHHGPYEKREGHVFDKARVLQRTRGGARQVLQLLSQLPGYPEGRE